MQTIAPEKVGLSAARLGRIRPAMQRYVDENKLAGVLTAVARHGHIAHLDTVGLMDVEANKPMQLDTIFRIYSMSKPITSVAVMMLYEENRFLLTDPVSRFIPEFEHVQVFVRKNGSGIELADPARPIAIHDLLTHTAGLAYGLENVEYVDQLYQQRVWALRERRPDMTLADMIRSVAALPLANQPGSRWHYSMATDVLGYLVEMVSGMPFDAFLKARIFEPLGMVDTGFHVPADKLGRFAATYSPGEKGGMQLLDAPATSRFARPTSCPSGGGGLVSTAEDYLRFAQMLLNDGELDGVRLLGRKTVELMRTNHLPAGMPVFEDGATGFGLGFGVILDVARTRMLGSVGSYSWGGAAGTKFWIDPQEDLIGLLMIQFMPSGHYPIGSDFQVLAYQAIVD
jgi:CubicO group peptidase (beta-lactamase class C family)